MVWTDALGPAAYIGRVRTVLLRNTGAALSPFNAFLFLQGLETLPLRMERHSRQRPGGGEAPRGPLRGRVGQLPGPRELGRTTTSPSGSLTGGFGGLVTFGITGGREAGQKFIESLELFSHLANIGDAKSLAIHNATTTHSQLNAGRARGRRRDARTWCACRSASSTSTTSSPTSSKWPRLHAWTTTYCSCRARC